MKMILYMSETIRGQDPGVGLADQKDISMREVHVE